MGESTAPATDLWRFVSFATIRSVDTARAGVCVVVVSAPGSARSDRGSRVDGGRPYLRSRGTSIPGERDRTIADLGIGLAPGWRCEEIRCPVRAPSPRRTQCSSRSPRGGTGIDPLSVPSSDRNPSVQAGSGQGRKTPFSHGKEPQCAPHRARFRPGGRLSTSQFMRVRDSARSRGRITTPCLQSTAPERATGQQGGTVADDHRS
jgi:hypothetical protein